MEATKDTPLGSASVRSDAYWHETRVNRAIYTKTLAFLCKHYFSGSINFQYVFT